MARSKQTARATRGSGRPGNSLDSAPIDDDISALIDYISRIPVPEPGPSDDELRDLDDLDERPTKRARLAVGSQYTTITQQDLAFAGTRAKILPGHDYSLRRDVGSYLAVNVIEGAPDGRGSRPLEVVLSAASSSPSGFLTPVKPHVVTPITPALAAAIRLAAKYNTDPEVDDALWVAMDAEVSLVDEGVCLRLGLRVNWNESASDLSAPLRLPLHKAKEAYLNDVIGGEQDSGASQTPWGPQDFYEATFVPDKDTLDSKLASMEVPALTATLYPFQKRAVHWLLEREGAALVGDEDGQGLRVQGLVDREASALPLSFHEWTDTNMGKLYVSGLFGVITRDIAFYRKLEDGLRGGILAEEMGLGKTLEITALVSLHRRPDDPTAPANTLLQSQLQPTGATLIIAPTSLLQQWLSELMRHAPSLLVFRYAGLKSLSKHGQTEQDMIRHFTESDIVLTTYEVLRSDFYSAMEPPRREMRNEKAYQSPKSPLPQMQWWRVCIDEAQMVENLATKTATLARLIPRVNAWSITGTPVKDDLRKDLRGLLVFLHYPWASSVGVWNRFTSAYRDEFQSLFRRISMRHTKSLVRDEIALPPQKRYVITMPFTAVEEQHYQELFQRLVQPCGLDTEGNPLREDWSPENDGVVESMRIALDRLRQTALHPEVGHHNRRALGHRSGPMRTVAEVLDAMLEQSESSVRSEQRALWSVRLTKGQLLEESPRVREALAIWQEVGRECERVVKELGEDLRRATEEAKEAGRIGEASRPNAAQDGDDGGSGKVADARRRLRSALEVHHRAVFFCANGYHQIKSNADMTVPGSEEFRTLDELETKAYEDAKVLRRFILQDTLRRATSMKESVAKSAKNQSFATITELPEVESSGIETRRIVDDLADLYAFLNEQANQLDEWREHVIQLLVKPLVDEDDEAEITGEEYDESTKHQEEIIVYVQVLRALVHDRQDVLSGQKNNLVEHERRGAIKLAMEGEGPSPEKLLMLFGVREELNQQNPAAPPTKSSLKAVVAELRTLSTKLHHEAARGSSRAELELEVVTQLLRGTTAQLSEQTKIALALEQEVERFAAVMNARVDFYRQFQAVSDMVAKYDGAKDAAAWASVERQEGEYREKLQKAEAKHRYLIHLKETDASSGESRTCVICSSPFSIGVLTVCGHQFCKECIQLWFRAHRNCPICKQKLQQSNMHDITLKPQELKVHSDNSANSGRGPESGSPVARTKQSTIYAAFSADKLAEIKNVELEGPSFTTKVDTLVRHLLWLREADPGAKSIVFSQYQEFMEVLRLALGRHRIGFASFSSPDGTARFKEDAAVEVFLLHARAHASGLNLVHASHVFLCEPLLNTALELQAIARVDRIGQRAHETTVWLYIVDGTVEESIYELSVRRRMEHMAGRNGGGGVADKGKGRLGEATPELMDASLEAANSLELQQASLSKLMGKGQSAGEAVASGDLWQCLFGHIARDREQAQDKPSNPAIRSFLAAEAAEARAAV